MGGFLFNFDTEIIPFVFRGLANGLHGGGIVGPSGGMDTDGYGNNGGGEYTALRRRRLAERRRQRRRRRVTAFLAVALLLTAVSALALSAKPKREESPDPPANGDGNVTDDDAGSTGGVSDISTVDAPKYEGPYADVFAELLVKNPELEAFIEGFDGEEKPDLTLDLGDELTDGEIPYLSQWDSRWGYCKYGSGLLGWTGCGPTALSMVAMGLTGDGTLTPAYVADLAIREGFCIAGAGTDWRLFSQGAAELGLTAKEIPLWEPTMRSELNAGRPIICIMGPGHFTDEGHYIVLTGCDEEGFHVLDPFRASNCVTWSYDDISGEIRNIWSYCKT